MIKSRTKRSWSSYRQTEDSDIRDALRALEMQKKSSDDTYYKRDDDFPKYDELFAGRDGDGDDDDRDAYPVPAQGQDSYFSIPSEADKESYPASLASYATPADMAELRDILEPSDDRRSSPLYEPEFGKEEESDRLGGLDVIDPEEMARLLAANGDDDDQDDDSSESSSTEVKVTPEPVSKAELEDIFNSENESKKSLKKKRPMKKRQDDKKKKKKSDYERQTREWIGKEYAEQPASERVDKKKRQASPSAQSDTEMYALENSILQKENEFLAGALNAATLGQMQRTDKYMKEQYDFLKKAVDMEETLQQLEMGEIEDVVGAEQEEGDSSEEESMAKRKRVDASAEEVANLIEAGEDDNGEYYIISTRCDGNEPVCETSERSTLGAELPGSERVEDNWFFRREIYRH